jgi:hypothetical protein
MFTNNIMLFFLAKDTTFFVLLQKTQRFCHAERSEVLQCECEIEPEKQLEPKFMAALRVIQSKFY